MKGKVADGRWVGVLELVESAMSRGVALPSLPAWDVSQNHVTLGQTWLMQCPAMYNVVTTLRRFRPSAR